MPHTPADNPIDVANADLLLTTTRAVRKRLDLERPVEPEVILDCIRIAVQAPTASNAQGWRWMVVTDPAKKAGLAELYSRAGRAYLEMGASGQISDDPQTLRVYRSAFYLVDVLADVPVHVIPCIEGRVGSPGNLSGASFYGSIMQAAWSFVLALRARGLGTVWTSLHLQHEEEAASLLGIPYESVSQIALLPVAYTKGTHFEPAERAPVEGITFWDEWGATRGL
jgi:nitroreductase